MDDSAEVFCNVISGFPDYNEKTERYDLILKTWCGESGGYLLKMNITNISVQ